MRCCGETVVEDKLQMAPEPVRAFFDEILALFFTRWLLKDACGARGLYDLVAAPPTAANL